MCILIRMRVFKKIRFSALIMQACLPVLICAQILPFDHYSVTDGLPSNWVTAIFQDSFGYLWLGTDEGITKYDGITFTNYGHEEGLPVNHVWAIAESKSNPGTLWVGTHGGGLCKFSNNTFTQIKLGDDISSNVVVALHEDETGTVWCATNTGVVQVYHDSVYISVEFERKPVLFLKSDSEQNVWTGIGNKIYKIYPGSKKNATYSPRLIGNDDISAFEPDTDGYLWVGKTSGELLLLREDESDSLILVASTQMRAYAQEIKADQQGNVWIAHPEDGISIASKMNNSISIVEYKTINGLIENRVSTCFVDKENNIWLGNYSRGLSKLSHKNFYFFYFSYPHSAVSVKNGRLYLVAEGGLYELWESSKGVWQTVFHTLTRGALTGEPYTVVADKMGNLGVLFTGGIGLYKIVERGDTESELILLKTFTLGEELPDGRIISLYVDSENTLWSLMFDSVVAVNMSNGIREKIFTEEDGMPGIDIRTMFQDQKGNYWFGDFVNGLSHFIKTGGGLQFRKKFTKDNGLPDNNIRVIAQRSNGDILIGTRFGGIAVIRDGEIIQLLTVKDGLLSNGIWSIAEDPEQRVWIATSLGINIIEPESMHVRTLHKLKGYYTGSIGMLANGTIWAVGRNELILYKHRNEPESFHPPPIGITGFRVNGTDIEIGSELKFPYDKYSVVVSFGGISFRDEEYLRYRYRLQGLDSLWSEPLSTRYVTFGSLRPGSYTFEVIAVTSDSVVSPVPARVSFVIDTPFWTQWWFITTGILLIIGVLTGLDQMRVRRILKIERIRSSIATDLHDDIGAGLTHIGLLSEVLLKKYTSRRSNQRDAAEYPLVGAGSTESDEHDLLKSIEHMGSISRELSGAMGDVVWSINPKYDSLESLLKRVSSFALELCKTKNIAIDFRYPDDMHKIRMNPEMRRNLLLIIKEAITNAVKYSQTASIEVDIRSRNSAIIVSVKDFGVGFDSNIKNDGNGIFNIRNRTIKMNGECTIDSAAGEGTTITVTVPL
jgi:ligand-binding sensor domain-containing protein/signal transduction histidine kinase